MDMTSPIRLLPTMEILQESFLLAGWNCLASISHPGKTYRNVRLFTGQQELLSDVVYTLRPGETNFPTDDYAYICTVPTPGKANHICCPGVIPEIVLDFLLELYSQLQKKEMLIDQLTYRAGTLQELCQLGEELLENPVCMHDDWFIMIGMSKQAVPLMAPEYLMTSEKGFLPRVILDDFQDDSDYLETYAHAQPQIWQGTGTTPSSLYVNLWDGAIYRGRLVIIQQNRDFRKADFILAQVLTQRALFLLQRQLPGQRPLKSMDDIVYSLLTGKVTEAVEQSQLLRQLRWDKSDDFVCIRLRRQQDEHNAVMEHVLHSDLFAAFPGSYILLMQQEQCLVLNLSRSQISYFHIPHHLAALCRDYCLYAGFSSPVSGVQEWHLAYHQAGVALEKSFQLRNERWIVPFSHCALEYMLHNTSGPLQPWHMIAPELRVLVAHDKEKGTQYFETFREYLLQERDIPRTTQKLIIHRTTLLYRLKKIQTLIQVNLEDPRQRLYLTASLFIMEKEQGRHP